MTDNRRSVVVAPWATLEADCLGHVLREVDVPTVQVPDDDTAAFVLALPRQMPASLTGLIAQSTAHRLPTLLLVDTLEPWTIALSRSMDASGLVSWRSSGETIVEAVQAVMEGAYFALHDGAATMDPFLHLSERERQVVALVSLGARDEEIAVRLGISVHTVRTHLQHALTKLDVAHRHAAASMAQYSPVMSARIWNLKSLDSIMPLRAG